MKILFVGDSLSAQYVSSFFDCCQSINGVTANIFSYGLLRKKNLITRIEQHFKNGLLIWNLNKKLLKDCKRSRYNLIFVYYSTLIYGSTIKRLNKYCNRLFMYCNDNPFSGNYKPYIWRHLISQIPYYDLVYAYRDRNINDYKEHGAKNVKLLMPYYIDSRNYYIPDEEIEINVPEVVFIGHIENDERVEYIQALVDSGMTVGLNSDWQQRLNSDKIIYFSHDEATQKYNEIINKAKIAIVFLSNLNKDTYTRRCFEIPATKTMMIAPYTKELAEVYEEDKEIVFFRGKQDFIDKIKYYTDHDDEREKIGIRGYARLKASNNEVRDRVLSVIEDYNDMEHKRD